MLGFHPIATFPIADIEDTVVDIVIQRDSKIKYGMFLQEKQIGLYRYVRCLHRYHQEKTLGQFRHRLLLVYSTIEYLL